MTAQAVERRSGASPAETQEFLRGMLADWYEKARELWKLTAEIGEGLVRARKQIPDEEWPAWLEAISLNQFAAFLFMRATRYPELMEQHKPANLDAVARLLPQGAGEAFDTEQAHFARRLHKSGMSLEAIRLNMRVSSGTVRRWVDPDGHAKLEERREEKRRRRAAEAETERERRRRAALKAKGGPLALAYQRISATVTEMDEAWRAETDPDRKRAFGAVLDALYKAKDKILAEGV